MTDTPDEVDIATNAILGSVGVRPEDRVLPGEPRVVLGRGTSPHPMPTPHSDMDPLEKFCHLFNSPDYRIERVHGSMSVVGLDGEVCGYIQEGEYSLQSESRGLPRWYADISLDYDWLDR